MSDRNPDVVRIGLAQLRISEDPEANLARAVEAIRKAADQRAQVVCLPELFRSRYFCQSEDVANFDLAEAVPGPTTDVLARVAAELDVVIVASLFERRAAGLYHNTAAVIDGARGVVGRYRKMHVPDDPRYYEKFYFTPGDLGFRSFPTAAGRLGVLICWDQWFPEAARLTAMTGAEILFYPTAIGWHPEEQDAFGKVQLEAWETIQRAHAIANGCFVVAVNRTGFELDPKGDGGIRFWGQSLAVGPDGRVLARASADEEAVLMVPLDRRRIREQREGWPFFRDRRIDAYGALSRRYID
ncbi:MAG: carbon-nitrogen hydrolase [Gammaproteobacteria bacterium]|jgi:N-carbamoylputrescine amidase|nr:carbon-nitrogen hydrolase [Gammaproteobacteria bacterium]